MITARLRRLGAYDLREEWDDICQETVWALVRAVRDGRAPAADRVPGYVAAVVRNQFVSWLRRRDARPSVAHLDEAGDLSSDESLARAGGAADADGYAAKQALSRLPERWQALLVARYVEGRAIETLVAASGRSRASLNRDLKRAREAFRGALLGDDLADDARPGEVEEVLP